MNFEEYIKSHKEALNTEVPDFKVWNAIQQQLQPKKTNYKYWLAAASVALVAAISLLFILQNKKEDNSIATLDPTTNYNKPTTKDTPSYIVQTIIDTPLTALTATTVKTLAAKPSKSVQQASTVIYATKKPTNTPPFSNQGFYDSTINLLKEKIQATQVKYVSSDYFKIYIDEYKNLEIEETNLRQQLQKNTTPETLIMQLIQVNQNKLNVLGNLLKQIESINAKKGDTIQTNYTKIII